jgi:hypothetical protein
MDPATSFESAEDGDLSGGTAATLPLRFQAN